MKEHVLPVDFYAEAINNWFEIVACGIADGKSTFRRIFGFEGLGDPRLLLMVCDFAFQKRPVLKACTRDKTAVDANFKRMFKFIDSSSLIEFDLLKHYIANNSAEEIADLCLKYHQPFTVNWSHSALTYIALCYPIDFSGIFERLLGTYSRENFVLCSDLVYLQQFKIPYFRRKVQKENLFNCLLIGYPICMRAKKEERDFEQYPTSEALFAGLYLYQLAILGVELFYEERDKIMELSFGKKECIELINLCQKHEIYLLAPLFIKYLDEFNIKDKFITLKLRKTCLGRLKRFFGL